MSLFSLFTLVKTHPIPGSMLLLLLEQSTSAGLGCQLAFLWHRLVNTLFGESLHQNVSSDPSSVELYIKTIEHSFFNTGVPQSAACKRAIRLKPKQYVHYYLCILHFQGLGSTAHSPYMLMCWIPPVPIQRGSQM